MLIFAQAVSHAIALFHNRWNKEESPDSAGQHTG